MRYLYLKGFKSQEQSHKDSKNYFYYKIADSIYQLDTKLHALEYLIQTHVSHQLGKNINHQGLMKTQSYCENTMIGEKNYLLKVLCGDDKNYQIQLNSDTYTLNNKTIKASASNLDMTILMGPAMILNLATNKVFCLHASAFLFKNQIKDTLFILMAESGTGKSTIARYMNQQPNTLRIADDIMPLKIKNHKLTALASFPQLKLNQQQQYKGDDVCTKTVLLFARKSKSETTINKINTFESMKNLIKHSVATKLFSENELNNHLKFCHEASRQTTAYQVNYQHTDNSLNQLAHLLYEII